MGYTIHHSPVYHVTYGDGYFNHRTAEINRLLQDNSENIHFEGYDIESAERLEVPRTDITDLIGKISRDKEKFGEWLRNHSIDMTPDQFICILCKWVSDSDLRNEYVALTWF